MRELDASATASSRPIGAIPRSPRRRPAWSGEWSGRQVLGHMAGWMEHAADALAAAAGGEADEFGEEGLDVEALNEEMARADATASVAALREREAAAAARLRSALENAEPAWLEERVAYGDSLSQVIRDDGADHYREHAADIRAWFAGGLHEADADDDEDEGEP